MDRLEYLNTLPAWRDYSPTEERDIFEKIKSGDKGMFEQVHLENLRLPDSRAMEYSGYVHGKSSRDEAYLDFMQVGQLILPRAIRKFDINMGKRFKNYADYWIKGAIRIEYQMIKHIPLGDQMVQTMSKITQFREEWVKTHHKAPTIEEIASGIILKGKKLTPAKILSVINTYEIFSVVSGDEEIGEDGFTRFDSISSEETQQPDFNAIQSSNLGLLDNLLDQLPDQQRIAVKLRYIGGHTLGEVAQALGCSVGKATALEARGMRNLRIQAKEISHKSNVLL